MGNGHPIAAVVTRREITEAMAERYEYFSTFAGSPVSAVAALATLDVLDDRRLPAKALTTGDYLRAALREVASEVTWLGPVRGRGLIAGLVVAAERSPGQVSAADVANRLRAARVLVGVTGPGRDVVKIRPPLVWEPEHVDLLVSELRRALAEFSAGAR